MEEIKKGLKNGKKAEEENGRNGTKTQRDDEVMKRKKDGLKAGSCE